jgi:hypothetical protein
MPLTGSDADITSFHTHATATNKTAAYGELTAVHGPATAMRVTISSYTSGSLTGYFIQAG